MSAEKHSVFVIMPFSEAFDDIFKEFIKATLEEYHFEVVRADDIQNAQSILKDIVQAIEECDLLVADLTDSNPNVYYELGLAHAFAKPVILLTQQIDELPFDLRSYRVVRYQTHFVEMDQAKRQLAELCRKFKVGSAQFGNPVTDFSGVEVVAPSGREQMPPPDQLDQPGFLDFIVETMDGFSELTELVTEYGARTSAIGASTKAAGDRFDAANGAEGSIDPREAKDVIAGLAAELESYAGFLKQMNAKYRSSLEKTRTALEGSLTGGKASNDEEKESLRKFLGTLDGAKRATEEGIDSTKNLKGSLESMPPVERTYNRARSNTVLQLKGYLANLEQTAAVIQRALDLGAERL